MKSDRSKAIRVFISYSRFNRPKVDKLYQILDETFTTWIDTQGLEAGQIWAEEIKRRIQECHVFLIVVSAQSVLSTAVASEYFFAKELGKPIIPILILIDATELPSELSRIQYLQFDATDRRQTDKIVQSIHDRYRSSVYANHNRATYSEPSFAFNDRSFGSDRSVATQLPDVAPVDLDKVYRAGNKAYAENDLERAMELWNTVLLERPSYQGGDLRDMVRARLPELRARLDSQIEQRKAEILDAERRHEATLGSWEALRTSIKKYEQAGYTDRTALNDVLYKCMTQAARIGNWDKAFDYLKELQRTSGLARQRRRNAKRQRRALEKNRVAVDLYDQARRCAQSQQDDATEEALQKLYKRAPAYGDPAGLIPQLVRKRIVKKEAERARIVHMREEIDKQRQKRIKEHPFSSRVTDLATSIGGIFNPKEPLPKVPPPVTQAGVEREIQDEVWPKPTRHLRLSAIPDALWVSLLEVLRGIRAIIVFPFRAFQETIWWGILAVLLFYGILASIIFAAGTQLGAIRLVWTIGALLVLVFLIVSIVDFVRSFMRGDSPFEMARPDVFDTLFD
jgi:tetratricopeptide (TPR) repeat protein